MVRVRVAAESDVDALIAFTPDPGFRAIEREQLREDFERARMRPSWAWLVEDAGALVGRALWWGRPDADVPLSLDVLDVAEDVDDRAGMAAEVLRAGHAALAQPAGSSLPQHTLRLPRSWRQDPAACSAVAWRRQACQRAGLSEELERLQHAWTAGGPVPAPSQRVRFRAGDDEEFVDLFARATHGSLDVETRRAVEQRGARAQARDDVDFYLSCPGERQWWRVAVDPDGAPVGFAIPSATPYHRNVGYLGVLPPWRGRGLVDDLLAEITRVHATSGAETITATTDTTNAPMAAAFDRAGYQITEVRLVLSAP